MHIVYGIGLYQEGTGYTHLKIGITSSLTLQARLSSLSTGSPFRLNPLFICHCQSRESALKLEKDFHLLLKDYSVRGEWFSVTPEMILLSRDFGQRQPGWLVLNGGGYV